MKTLFHNAKILTGDGNWTPIENGYLVVEDDRISDLGSGQPNIAAEVKRDCGGMILMPGLYNAHSHTPMSLLRGIGTGLTLQEWLFDKMFPLEAAMNEEDIRLGCRLAVAEMLAGGVVSVSDMYHFPGVYVQEILDAGIKANLCFPLMDVNPNGHESDDTRFRASVDFVRTYDGAGNGRVKGDFSIHAEYTNSAEGIERYARICREMNGRMQLHLSETVAEHEGCKRKYGKTPTRFFADLGVFDSPTTAAHCVHVEPEDIEILAKYDVVPAHNPSSNLKLGSGVMPMREMLDAGLRVAIGTDGSASNNNQNILEELHLAAMIHPGVKHDPTLLRAEEMLEMATINGARTQGRTDCGALKVGYKADMILIDTNKAHLIPDHDTAALIVYSAQASDVALTMIDGCVVYENDHYLTLDFARLKTDIEAATARIFDKK